MRLLFQKCPVNNSFCCIKTGWVRYIYAENLPMESYGQSSTYMDHRVIQATLPSTHSPPGLNPSLSFKAQDQTSTPSSLLQSFYGLINHRATQSQAEMVFWFSPINTSFGRKKITVFQSTSWLIIPTATGPLAINSGEAFRSHTHRKTNKVIGRGENTHNWMFVLLLAVLHWKYFFNLKNGIFFSLLNTCWTIQKYQNV